MGWKRKKLDAMGDEDFYDVHLVGRDGEEVPCCKAILGTTSPVFKAMFFRGFREQKSDRCSLDFHSLVISVVVKYCYCGEVDMDLIFSKNKSLGEEASLLIELREAGRYFEIDDLLSSAEAKIGSLVFQRNTDLKKYQYVSAFLTELRKHGQDSGPLWQTLFQIGLYHRMECFGPITPETNTIDTYHAHPDVLARMFTKSRNTYAAVRCIQTWFSLENKSAGNGYSDEEKQNLIKVAENIDLRKLSTKQLSEISPCSLFPSERILEAFVHHCKSSEIIPEKPRTEPRLFISGARIEYLIGGYNQVKTLKNIYAKRVEHNGTPCLSIIHRRQAESKWLVSITMNETLQLNHDEEVDDSSIQIHVYESTGLTEDPNLPPFNSWKCIQGTCEVPFVAFIYK